MLGRIIFAIITLLSIVWIAVASFVQNQQTTQFKLEELFGPKDQEIIIINDFKDVAILLEDNITHYDWKPLIDSTSSSLIKTMILSKKQAQVLIQTTEIVSPSTLQHLFGEVQIKKGNQFQKGKWSGHYNLTNIYLSIGQIPKNTTKWEMPNIDKNAAANYILFNNEIIETRDFYNRKTGEQLFTTQYSRQKNTPVINDAEVFAHILSNQITDYAFYSKLTAYELEPNILQHAWVDLLESGLVATQIGSNKGIYFDAKPNTDIYQLTQNQSNDGSSIITFDTKTESSFFNNRKTLFIGNLDDHYVVSASKQFCEEALAHYKLGNVLQTNPSKMSRIYSGLPRKVHTRTITKEQQTASRYVPHQYLQFAKLGKASQKEEQPITSAEGPNSPKHFNIGTAVKFAEIDGSGRVVALDESMFIHYYGINGKILSANTLSDFTHEPTFISRIGGEQLLCVANAKHIIIYAPTGATAFHLEPKGNYNFRSIPVFARVKSKDYLLVGANDGTIYWYNTSNGKVERQTKISSNKSIEKIAFWTSGGKGFIGATYGTQFHMINAETNKPFRNFAIGQTVGAALVKNDFKQVVFERNQVRIINQKGGATSLALLNGFTTVRPLDAAQTNYIACDGANRFVAFNISGEIILDRTLTGTTIDQFSATQRPDQSILVACLDELNNKIKLVNLSTEQSLLTDDLNGSGKVLLHANGKSVFLYTLIDNILIRYDR